MNDSKNSLQLFKPMFLEGIQLSNKLSKYSFKQSVQSDSVDFTRFHPFARSVINELADSIHGQIYQLKVQQKRVEYLQNCNNKNNDIAAKIIRNQKYQTQCILKIPSK
ncbi:Hypothetical_protein [Hexamita inflata]|uniref:Hypothetical_protein n=1 Tax=Hexamita inflata TaxID=28002 RepID=A0AA86RKZ5_9EUKA|nr:Hypothetical protein HINF_LOCUS64408 [Hexamita inflata]